MSRHLVTLGSASDRERAARYIAVAPLGTRVEFKAARRSLPQNDHMWALLTDVAVQREHHGRKYTPDQWKVIFMHACGNEVQFLPSLNGATFIPWGQSSSDLGKDEMSQLIDFIYAWGAENGIAFHDPHSPPEPEPPSRPEATPAPAPGPASAGAGTSSQSPSRVQHDGEERQASAQGNPAPEPAGLPEDWRRQYAAALATATKVGQLPRKATAFWERFGGWGQFKTSTVRGPAEQIYDAFANHFDNTEARETILRELDAA